MPCLCEQVAGDQVDLSPICIGHLWVFADLKPEELKALGAAAVRRRFAKGQAIFRQGDPATQMFLIKAGRVKLIKQDEDGQETTLDIRKAGDFLGENMLNEEGALPLTAVALGEVLTCGFGRRDFEQLVLQHPGIGLQVIKNLSRRIDWLTSRVGSMSHTNLEERLYRVLLQVAREHGAQGRQGLVLDMPLTHEDLSFLVGAHRVSITRAMKDLQQSGRVLRQGRVLILPEPQAAQA
ncbi:MAG: Crp/Fnr family transcriptional regulator [Pseudomonadota bacterium]